MNIAGNSISLLRLGISDERITAWHFALIELASKRTVDNDPD